MSKEGTFQGILGDHWNNLKNYHSTEAMKARVQKVNLTKTATISEETLNSETYAIALWL